MDIFIAKEINNTTFRYRCNRCYSRYKKNGEPCKNAYLICHTHGSNGDLSNRVETRTAHCKGVSREVEIIINDETLRK